MLPSIAVFSWAPILFKFQILGRWLKNSIGVIGLDSNCVLGCFNIRSGVCYEPKNSILVIPV